MKRLLCMLGIAAAATAAVLAVSAILDREQRLAHQRAQGRGR